MGRTDGFGDGYFDGDVLGITESVGTDEGEYEGTVVEEGDIDGYTVDVGDEVGSFVDTSVEFPSPTSSSFLAFVA